MLLANSACFNLTGEQMLIQRSKIMFLRPEICQGILGLAAALVGQLAWAAPQDLAIPEGSRIEILAAKDVSVQLSVTGLNNVRTLRMDTDAELNLSRRNDLIILNISGKKGDHVKLDLQGRSVPLTVHLYEGQILVKQWQSDALLHLQNGKLNVQSLKGVLVSHVQKGEVHVTDQVGKVLIDSFQAGVIMKSILGDVELQSFSGEINIEKVTGHLALNVQQAVLRVAGGQGSLEFESQKGGVHINKFQGRIEGQSQEGDVQLSLANDQDVSVKTRTAKMVVFMPAGGTIDAMTSTGDIGGPAYLKVVHDGSTRVLRGKLKGDSSGTVTLRSQEGFISIR